MSYLREYDSEPDGLPYWKSFFRSKTVAILLLSFLTWLIYEPGFDSQFILDSVYCIEKNPTIHDLSDMSEVLRTPPNGCTTQGRPFLNFSFALNYYFSGPDPYDYQVTNMVIHALAAFSLYLFLRALFRLPVMPEGINRSYGRLALAISLIWAVHPLNPIAVTYTIQRAESLMALLYVLTLYAVLKVATSAKGVRWGVFAVVCCFLGMATKEVMVSAPLAAYLLDAVFISKSFSRPWKERKWLYLALCFTWIVLIVEVVVLGSAHRDGTAGFKNSFGMNPWNYFRTQWFAIMTYFKLSVWPHPLIFDYGYPVIDGFWKTWPWAAVLAASFIYGMRALVDLKPIGYSIIFVFAILAPTSSFIPVATQTIGEQRFYLPLMMVISVYVLGFRLLWVRFVEPRMQSEPLRYCLSVGLVFLVVAGLSILTYERVARFTKLVDLWSYNIEHWPLNPRPYTDRGNRYMDIGLYDLALADYTKGAEVHPKPFLNYYNRGNLYRDMGQFELAESDYKKAIELAPKYYSTYINYGGMLKQLRRDEDSVEIYSKAIDVHPQKHLAYVARALVLNKLGLQEHAIDDMDTAIEKYPRSANSYYVRGTLYAEHGQTSKAIDDFNKALSINPRDTGVMKNLYVLLRDLGRFDDQLEVLNRSIAVNNRNPVAYFDRAVLKEGQEDLEGAVYDYGMAIFLNSNYFAAYNNRGNLYSRMGDKSKAESDLLQAIRIGKGDNYAPFMNLAVLYTDQRRIRDAVNALKQAREIAPEVPDIKRRLAWLIATTEGYDNADLRLALKLASEVMESKNPTAQDHAIYAAAQGSSGLYDEALATLGQATELAEKANEQVLLDEIGRIRTALLGRQPYYKVFER